MAYIKRGLQDSSNQFMNILIAIGHLYLPKLLSLGLKALTLLVIVVLPVTP